MNPLMINWSASGVMHFIENFMTRRHLIKIAGAVLILFLGIMLSRRIAQALRHVSGLDPQQQLIFQKLTSYTLIGVSFAAALHQLGFDLRVLLGAAGVLTVAIGFAAQTSASNLISGLFLILDKPFRIGDVVDVTGIRGEVLSIDLLSCRIRTFDNVLVRVPNEVMIKSPIKNFTHFPIRRIDLKFSVLLNSDLALVRETLLNLARQHPSVLEEPVPLLIMEGFNESGIAIQFSIWTLTDNLIMTQNEFVGLVQRAFEEKAIGFSFPHRIVIS